MRSPPSRRCSRNCASRWPASSRSSGRRPAKWTWRRRNRRPDATRRLKAALSPADAGQGALNPFVAMTLGLAFDHVLAAAQAGAGWARARLYESLAPAVAGYARAQRVDDPADVTSDVFVAVLTALPSFNGDEAQFRSWVFTIAYRKVADSWRARTRPPRAMPAPE